MISSLDRGLAELGAAALVVVAENSRDPDLARFAGPVHLGECFLIVPRGARPRLGFYTPMERDEAAATGLDLLQPADLGLDKLLREAPTRELAVAGALERALRHLAIEPNRIALAGTGPAGTLWETGAMLARAGWTPVSGNRLTRLVRKAKTAAEIAEARRVAAGAASAFRQVAGLLAAASVEEGELRLGGEGLTVGRLKREIARSLADFELEQPRGNIVAPAEEGAVPHSSGTGGRALRAGQSIVVDLFPKGWLFADCTRTFCVGRPPEPLAAAHGAVLAALERSHERLSAERVAARPRGHSLQASVCSGFKSLGYPTPVTDPGTTVGYVHNLGHGVGFDLHEYPSFRREAGEEGVLEVGDLVTVEPGLYDPGAGWGVRLEDMVHLSADGPENLTPLPYALDPGEWV